jgi:hypothetical protein
VISCALSTAPKHRNERKQEGANTRAWISHVLLLVLLESRDGLLSKLDAHEHAILLNLIKTIISYDLGEFVAEFLW